MAFLGGIFDNTPIGALLGSGSPIEGIFNPSSWWEKFKNGETNEVNKEIADENLDYQKDRSQIEDERYAEETAYNRSFAEDERAYQRAFAEDERAYNRALQQTLFEREDTALERQAQSLSSMGINPLSQQLNGLGAGQALTPSSAAASAEPSMSSRGGSALHNDFQMKDQGMLPILSSMLSMVDTVNGVKTGEYNRDSLALQNDAQFLSNLEKANSLGINYNGYLPYSTGGKNYRENTYNFYTKSGENLFDSDLFKSSLSSQWRKNKKDSMPNWQYTLDLFGNDDVYNQAEKALTKGSQLFDKVYDNVQDKDNYSKNPFRTLFNLFF